MRAPLKTIQRKIIAWLSIISSVGGVLVLGAMLLWGSLTPNVGHSVILALSSIGAYGGWLTLHDHRRGKQWLVVFYLLQLVSIQTPSFYLSLATGISFHITLSSAEGGGFALNLYALLMLLLCIRLVREDRNSASSANDDEANRTSASAP